MRFAQAEENQHEEIWVDPRKVCAVRHSKISGLTFIYLLGGTILETRKTPAEVVKKIEEARNEEKECRQ